MKKYLFGFLILGFSLNYSCGKLGASGGKKVLGKSGRKAIQNKSAGMLSKGTISLAAGVGAFFATDALLRKAFEDAETKRPPIKAQMMNKTGKDLPISILTDGQNWKHLGLDAFDDFTVQSDSSGLIGIQIREQIIQVDRSNIYVIENNNGEIHIHARD